MKQTLIVAACVIGFFAGCHKAETSHVTLVAEPNSNFPDFLVGTWKEDKFNWQITFEKGGKVSTFINYLIEEPMSFERGGFYVEGQHGAYATSMLGPYSVYYIPESRALNVRLTVDYFRLEIPAGSIEGSQQDFLLGFVSPDGKKWNVNWLNYGVIQGADRPDTGTMAPEQLEFKKVSSAVQ